MTRGREGGARARRDLLLVQLLEDLCCLAIRQGAHGRPFFTSPPPIKLAPPLLAAPPFSDFSQQRRADVVGFVLDLL